MRSLKKGLSLLLCCLLFLSLSPAHAATRAAVLELETARSDGEWSVTVKLKGGTRPKMIQFSLGFDCSLLTLKSAKTGSAFSVTDLPAYSMPGPGCIAFAWESLTGLSDGRLLELTFAAKPGASGRTEIFFRDNCRTVFMDGTMTDIVVFTDRTELDLGERDEDGSAVYAAHDMVLSVGHSCLTNPETVCVSSDPETVLIENGELRGVSVGFAAVTAFKDGVEVGSCNIVVREEPAREVESDPAAGTEEEALLYGDTDCNGTVDMADAYMVHGFIGGEISFSYVQVLAADVNGDGKIDEEDTELIRRYSVGSITAFPAEE